MLAVVVVTGVATFAAAVVEALVVLVVVVVVVARPWRIAVGQRKSCLLPGPDTAVHTRQTLQAEIR